METIQLIGILLVFFIMVGLMMARKLPTIIALPVMAIAISFIAGVTFMSSDPEKFTIVKDVLEAGSMRMSTAISGLVFGAIFGKVLSKVGVTETIIKKAAELAGDKALPIALVFLAVCSVIFAASNGLGMVILVGTIIIPIMISAGLSPMISGIILLLSSAIGVTFSVNTLAVYLDVLKLDLDVVTGYSWMVGLPLIIVSVIMIIYYIQFQGKTSKAWAMPNNARNGQQVRAIALISPIVPVALVFAFKVPLIASILIGIVVALVLSTPKNPIHVVSSAFVEGIQDVAGAMGLMIGIGMLLNAVMSSEVSAILSPAISLAIPKNQLMFVLIFGLLSPLAIYRGPLNVWGLGSGIISLLVASGMNPVAAMVALRLDSNVQAVCDPTNSHNVWIADFTKTDVNEILKKTILWISVSTLIGLIISSFFLY
ncbi:MAG: citrate transporter [Faecalicoccus sp.]|uniref:citrate transporter n=1 Tax=Faecalicoccus TaxID=1573536 RepID=UPI0023313D02|nr:MULTISPECIES: citrate transporter [Faecalicoccus]MCI6380344.1 citrate transporter [Erysipelotrichaceae bacterium]MDB7987744.1 citrate transporter [Faecalicoccus pleomorphus]MDB7992211.1 citrate transporter [Faecalicoccus pleomorphus]MDY4279017.1 citrate transporter [Faecalicoccus sp.]MDY4869198.1 citrate transporter [Faecalicoccus sp.]